MKQHKTFKRDLKLSPGAKEQEVIAFELLRANLEFLRGNHRKAQKLLVMCSASNEENISPLVASMIHNNHGCINMMINKPHLAVHSLELAFNSHLTLTTQPGFVGQMDLFLTNKKSEMLYNMAIAHLHCGNYEKAFEVS